MLSHLYLKKERFKIVPWSTRMRYIIGFTDKLCVFRCLNTCTYKIHVASRYYISGICSTNTESPAISCTIGPNKCSWVIILVRYSDVEESCWWPTRKRTIVLKEIIIYSLLWHQLKKHIQKINREYSNFFL